MKFIKEHKPWNKGKKGIHLSAKSEFKKGIIPWNKGKKMPSLVGNIYGFKRGHSPWNKGIKTGIKPWLGKKRPDMIGNTRGFVKGKPSPRKGERGKHKAWNSGKSAKDDNRILSGKNSPRYKDGLSRGYKTGYYSTDYKKWRMSVFIRDNFTCQGCQKVGNYLNAHHIKQFAYYPKLRFVVSNGITLCVECHKLIHKLQYNTLKL